MERCICSKIFGDDEWTYTLLILKHNVIIYKYLKVSTLILYFMYNYSKPKEIRTDFFIFTSLLQSTLNYHDAYSILSSIISQINPIIN